MRIPYLRLAVMVLTTIVSVAQETPSASPSSADGKNEQATVYVYRYKQFVGGALEPSVYCDEVQLARMDNGRYFAVKVDPGKHTFRSNDAQSGMEIEAKAGQQYFLRVEIATGFMKGHGRLIMTAPEQGRYELNSSKLKPLDANKVMDKSRVSVEPVKLQTPAPAVTPAASTQPAPANPQPPSAEHPISGVTISDGSSNSASSSGEVSLGEAARRARQK